MYSRSSSLLSSDGTGINRITASRPGMAVATCLALILFSARTERISSAIPGGSAICPSCTMSSGTSMEANVAIFNA